MAQDKFQPVVGGIGNPVYIRPGVQNNSAATLLGTVPTLIGMADKAYEAYSLNKAINTEVKPIVDTYEAGYQGDKDKAALVYNRENIFKDAELKSAMGEDISSSTALLDANQADLDKAMKNIEAAKAQGILSPAQAMAKITKATREAVAKNPWLEAQLYERVQQHLKRTGTLDVWKERESIAQNNADMMQKEKTYFRTQIDDLAAKGYPVQFNEHGSPEEWRSQLNAVNGEVAKEKFLDAEAKRVEKRPVTDLLAAMSNGQLPQLRDTELNRFDRVATQLLSSTGFGSQGRIQAIEQIRREGNRLKDLWTAKYLANGMSDPTIKAFAESTTKYVDNQMEIYEKVTSQEDLRKAIANNAEMRSNLQSIEASGMMNMKAFAVVESLAKVVDPVRGLAPHLNAPGNEKQKGMVYAAIGSMMQGAVNNEAVQGFLTSEAPSQTFIALGQGLMANKNPFRQEEDIDNVLQYVSKMTEALVSPETGLDPKEQASSSLKFLSTVASKPEFKEVLASRSDYGLSVGRVVDNHMNGVIDTFAAVVFKHSAENPSLKFTYDVKENGAFEMITNDPTVSKAINEKLSTQVNIALDAYANSLGISRQQAAPAFYSQYFAELTAGDKDLISMQKAEAFTKPITGDEPLRGVTPLQEEIRITPEQQKTRDETRVRVLQQELQDYSVKGDETNAKFVEEELKGLGVVPSSQPKPKKKSAAQLMKEQQEMRMIK